MKRTTILAVLIGCFILGATAVVAVAIIRVTFTKTPARGSFGVVNNGGNNMLVECSEKNDTCGYTTAVIFKNRTGQTLYDVGLWTGGGNIEYTNENGGYTSDLTFLTRSVPANGEVNVGVRVRWQKWFQVNTSYNTLYIDGKTCNTNVTPWDCYYYGGGSFEATLKYVPSLMPSPMPTPTPKSRIVPIPVPSGVGVSGIVPPRVSTRFPIRPIGTN